MYRQRRMLYAQANMLVRKFHYCSDEVKVNLFRAALMRLKWIGLELTVLRCTQPPYGWIIKKKACASSRWRTMTLSGFSWKSPGVAVLVRYSVKLGWLLSMHSWGISCTVLSVDLMGLRMRSLGWWPTPDTALLDTVRVYGNIGMCVSCSLFIGLLFYVLLYSLNCFVCF